MFLQNNNSKTRSKHKKLIILDTALNDILEYFD